MKKTKKDKKKKRGRHAYETRKLRKKEGGSIALQRRNSHSKGEKHRPCKEKEFWGIGSTGRHPAKREGSLRGEMQGEKISLSFWTLGGKTRRV